MQVPRDLVTVLALAAVLVGACSAEPGVSSPSPTLNPNELARQSRSPAPPAQPTAGTPSAAAPSVTGSSAPIDPSSGRPVPTPFAPDLEALLPSELRGHPLLRFSFPGAAVGATGDICSYVCPGEPHALAAALGVDVDQVDVAIAYPDDAVADFPRVVIVAYRVRGVATERLIPARREAMEEGHGLPPIGVDLVIAGKPVTWARYGVFASATTMEYLYAKDDVLFRVIDGVEVQPDVAPLPDTVLAIDALP